MSNTTKLAAAVLAIVAAFGAQTYSFVSAKNSLQTQISDLQMQVQEAQKKSSAEILEVAANLETGIATVSDRVGITSKELEDARRIAANLRQEQARTAEKLASELRTNSNAIGALREEASTKLTELSQVQTEANTKIGAVSGDVQVVKTDLDSTRKDLAASRNEMTLIRDSLGREIARNSSEVAELRRRGERDYQEFSVAKLKNMSPLATGVQIQLKKADTKNQKYDVTLMIDDTKVEKKNLIAKEPVTFLVGRDRLRYELVVYAVDKDRIRGYVSTPKDNVLSAEGPRVP